MYKFHEFHCRQKWISWVPMNDITAAQSLAHSDLIMSTIWDDLHWLLVVQRINFKQCTLVYTMVQEFPQHGSSIHCRVLNNVCTLNAIRCDLLFMANLVMPPPQKQLLNFKVWNLISLEMDLTLNELTTLLYCEAFHLKLQVLSWWLFHKIALYNICYLLTLN